MVVNETKTNLERLGSHLKAGSLALDLVTAAIGAGDEDVDEALRLVVETRLAAEQAKYDDSAA